MPLLVRLGFDRLGAEAGYPGSEMVPALSAMLSLLALKLLDKERRSHIDDFNCDEPLGWFAGLNILPKKSFATDYSYRVGRAQQLGLLQGWVKTLAPVMFPEAEGFSLDFHPIPFRGDPAALDRHYLPRRGKAGPSVLTFFALEQASRCLCYAHANLTRADQHGELIRFVEFWREVAGSDPQWLYFDSKVVANRQRIVQSGGSFFRHRITCANVGQNRHLRRRMVEVLAGTARWKHRRGVEPDLAWRAA